jgi:hypothetical protein
MTSQMPGSAGRRDISGRAARALVAHPVRTLLILWLVQSLYLTLLQTAGMSYGFAVWPMGEDRNWLRFMLDAPRLGMMRQFWLMNDRNPLSPWWYWLLSWPILHYDPTLYLVRRLADPLLAVAVTLLTGRLIAVRQTPLPLVAGVLVLACNFSDYREQIVWNFLLALAIALFAVYLYVVYVDSRRIAAAAFGAALILFLIAIATYTLELGLLLAVGAVALFRDRGTELPAGGRLKTGLVEFALFGAIALVFLMIWYTVARPSSSYYHLDPALIRSQAIASIGELLWHHDFSYWFSRALRSPGVLAVASPIAVLHAAVIMIVVLGLRDATRLGRNLAWVGIVLAAIAVPIVLLESMSDVWLPGYRSRMIYQISAPLLFVLAGAMGTTLLARIVAVRVSTTLFGCLAAVVSMLVVAAAFEYNRQLVVKTAKQRNFAEQLAVAAQQHPSAHVLLVRYPEDPRPVWGSDTMSDTYARTMLRRQDITMRFVQSAPSPQPLWAPWWRVQLNDDDHGVGNVGIGVSTPAPYSTVLFIDYDGERVTVPRLIDAAWFDGLQADWHRTAPIVQHVGLEFTCPARFDFSEPPHGTGWSVPELQGDGRYNMWMASTRASMELSTSCAGPVTITLAVTGYMAEDIIRGLGVRVDGQPVTLRMSTRDQGGIWVTGPFDAAGGQKHVNVELSVPRTVVPAGGDRTLAIMFGGMTIERRTASP